MQQHHIARHKLCRGDPQFLAAASHGCIGDNHFRERIDGLLRLSLLDVTDDGIDKGDSENDCRIRPLANFRGDRVGCDHDVNERLMELQKKAHPLTDPLLHGYPVRPKLTRAYPRPTRC